LQNIIYKKKHFRYL